MIVPMKKYTVVSISSDKSATVALLRELGLLHVSVDSFDSDSIDKFRDQKGRIEKSLSILRAVEEEQGESEVGNGTVELKHVDRDVVVADADKVIELSERKSALSERKERLYRDLEDLKPWGDASPEKFQALADAGFQVRLYRMTPDLAKEFEAPGLLEFSRDKSSVRFVSVALPGEVFPERPDPVPFPERSVAQINEEVASIEKAITDIDTEVLSFGTKKNEFSRVLEGLQEDIDFVSFQGTMDGNEDICWITGFAPADEESRISEEARKNGWGLVNRDPDEEDMVPTKIKNPKPVSIIEPVFDLMGTVPGYQEVDISFWFLIFFTIFFAMIIGDGGYGLLMLLGSLWATIKSAKSGKGIGRGHVLFIVLTTATVVWGAVTGNWFGYEKFAELPFLESFVVEPLASSNPVSATNVQWICFIMGTVHLSIAHGWRIIRGLKEKPRIRALTDFGSLIMVLGLYYLVLQIVIDSERFPMPKQALYMVIAGFVLVVVCSKQEVGQNFFKGAMKGVADIISIALDSISAFSDIISYIRLYAVGLATLAIAQSFNTMAQGINESMGGVAGIIVAVLVLCFGHTLNLLMGALSVLVHGVRLNMLEFSGHLGMEWTGVAYAPFHKRNSA